uniref:Sorting nexin N-terminal domain-containing protein n=1 Tax=Chrysemys picta bellii TaxID=8478 RepID=A0A8C3I5T1_CHRPI
MASGGACSSSPSAERLPPPFPRAEGDVDSDTEGEDIFTGASKPQSPKRESPLPVTSSFKENGVRVEQDDQDLFADQLSIVKPTVCDQEDSHVAL